MRRLDRDRIGIPWVARIESNDLVRAVDWVSHVGDLGFTIGGLLGAWTVRSNLEWYYENGHFGDQFLSVEVVIGGYPSYPPTPKQACAMADLSIFVRGTVQAYFGPPPGGYVRRCHPYYLSRTWPA